MESTFRWLISVNYSEVRSLDLIKNATSNQFIACVIGYSQMIKDTLPKNASCKSIEETWQNLGFMLWEERLESERSFIFQIITTWVLKAPKPKQKSKETPQGDHMYPIPLGLCDTTFGTLAFYEEIKVEGFQGGSCDESGKTLFHNQNHFCSQFQWEKILTRRKWEVFKVWRLGKLSPPAAPSSNLHRQKSHQCKLRSNYQHCTILPYHTISQEYAKIRSSQPFGFWAWSDFPSGSFKCQEASLFSLLQTSPIPIYSISCLSFSALLYLPFLVLVLDSGSQPRLQVETKTARALLRESHCCLASNRPTNKVVSSIADMSTRF